LRKVRKLSLLGILSVFVVVMFLAAISLLKAQDNEATWAVRIPTLAEAEASGLKFFGMNPDGYYENNGSTVTVNVTRNKVGGVWGHRYYDFDYYFNFRITNENLGSPPSEFVGFREVSNSDWDDPVYPDEGKPCCQFPGDQCEGVDCLNCLPYCVGTFLNGTHPHQDYESFYFVVEVFDHDIELMQPGEYYFFGSASEYLIEHDLYEPGDYLFMVARYRNDCYADPPYHDIEIMRNINYLRARDPAYNNAINIVVERLADPEITCDGVWRIWVLDHDVLDENFPGYLKVQERYCDKNKWYYSMEAKNYSFNFYIDFIKNPQPSTPPEEPPVAPGNLETSASSCTQIDLSWTDNSDNETGFEIERDGTALTTVNSNVTFYADITVFEDTTYSYRVRAFNDAGSSAYSNEASATTPPCGTDLPEAPTGLTAKQPGAALKVMLGWTDNSTNEEGFKIYRDGTVIASVGPDTTSYVDEPISPSTTYSYIVCAYNSSGERCSGPVSITTR